MTTLNIRIDREDKLRAESIQKGGSWSPILQVWGIIHEALWLMRLIHEIWSAFHQSMQERL